MDIPGEQGDEPAMTADATNLTLWYGSVLIGTIKEPFQDQGTWFGTLRRQVLADEGPQSRRLLDFINFCQDWNERTLDNQNPPDAAEFDKYSDLLTSGQWITKDAKGNVGCVLDAPVFFKGDEVTWTATLRR